MYWHWLKTQPVAVLHVCTGQNATKSVRGVFTQPPTTEELHESIVQVLPSSQLLAGVGTVHCPVLGLQPKFVHTLLNDEQLVALYEQ